MNRSSFAFAAFAAGLFAGEASATIITSAADPALAGGTVVDFSSATQGSAPSFTVDGVTFSALPGDGSLTIGSLGSYGGVGNDLQTQDLNGSATPGFSITLPEPVSAFGMVWGAANPNWTVSAYDSSDALIESVTFVGGDHGASYEEFYGIAASGIASVVLIAGSYDWIVVDDFTYVAGGGSEAAVPVPAAAPLALMGFAALFGLARSRRG